MIQTTCPECSKPVKVPRSQAGKVETCIHCGKEMTIPKQDLAGIVDKKFILGMACGGLLATAIFVAVVSTWDGKGKPQPTPQAVVSEGSKRQTSKTQPLESPYKAAANFALTKYPNAFTGKDWPQFKRDAARTGNAPGEALELPLKQMLAVRFPAPIYASPAVVDGKVYLQDSHGHLACLAAAEKNKVLWVTNLGGVANHSSPAVWNSRVFVGSTAGYMAILDATTGRLLKKVPAGGGVIAAPAIANGAVYFASVHGCLYKVDFDGNIVWKLQVADSCHVDIAVQGKTIVMLARACHILEDEGDRAIEVREVWRRVHCPSGGPAFVGQSHVAFQGFDSEFGRLTLLPVSDQDGVNSARLADHNDSRATPSVRDGLCYRGDVGLSSSGKVVWRADCPDLQPGGFHSSPALAKDHLVLGTESGRVYFFPIGAPNSEMVKPAWIFSTRGAGSDANCAVSSSPAVSDGNVYFGGEDGLLYGLGTGAEVDVIDLLQKPPATAATDAARKLKGPEWPTAGGDMGYSGVSPDRTIRPPFRIKWRTRVWSTFKSGPIVADGKAFAAGRMGQLTALDAESGDIIWRTHHGFGESRPAPIYSNGHLLVMRGAEDQHRNTNSSGGIWCHVADTGKLLWRKSLLLGYHFNADGLTADDDKCFVCWNGGGGAVEAAAYRLGDGSTVWQRRYEGLIPTNKVTPIRHASALGDGKLFFSVTDSETLSRKRHIDELFGATIAVDPSSGEPIWRNTDFRLVRGSRASYRKGLFVVFSPDGAHALDAKTGKLTWSSPPPEKLYYGHYYMNALTDEFLESKGQRGLFGYIPCSYPIYVNGLWYGHTGQGTRYQAAWSETPVEQQGREGQYEQKVVWRHRFLGRACPSPAAAYGRLYYVPNGDGVIYCFENSTTNENPPRPPHRTAAALYELAWLRRKQNDVDGAIRTYIALIEEFPKSEAAKPARTELADLLFARKDYAAAAKLLAEALKDKSAAGRPGPTTAYRLGHCLVLSGLSKEAAVAFDSFAGQYPMHAQAAPAKYVSAMIYVKFGDFPKARKKLIELLKTAPAGEIGPSAQILLGNSYAAAGDFKSARGAYALFLKRYPKSKQLIQGQYGVGWALHNQGRFAEARAWYAKVVSTDNGLTAAKAQLQIGRTHWSQGEFRLATREYLKVEILYNYAELSSKALYEAGLAFEKLSDMEMALKEYSLCVKKYRGTQSASLAAARIKAIGG